MSFTMSPLRYPGSKQKALSKIKPFWAAIENQIYEYREPFLGGCSIFLNLNTSGKKVILNDKDENIATLFQIIRDCPEELCKEVTRTVPSIELWGHIRNSTPKDDIGKAFRTLFLNRTNYSGILSANPIGGFQQKSKYSVGCRWNANGLVRRIHACSEKLKGAEITSEDFFYSIIKPSKFKTFLFIDPPYYTKGNQLYDEIMSREDHWRLRELLAKTQHSFLLTYDACNEVFDMYKDIPGLCFYETGWRYTTSTVEKNSKRPVGKELFITNLRLAEDYHELKKRAF